jgi:organic radical activating enzyme
MIKENIENIENVEKYNFTTIWDNLYINNKAKDLAKVHKDNNENKIGNVYTINPFSEIDDPGYNSMAIFFNYCNLACSSCCMQPLLKGAGVIPFYLDYINEYADSIDGITLVGGEPLIQDADNLEKIMRRAKELNLRVNINTNGIALWEPEIKALWPLIDKVNIHFTEEAYSLGLHERINELPFEVETTVIWHPWNFGFLLNAIGMIPAENFRIKKDFYLAGGICMINTKV